MNAVLFLAPAEGELSEAALYYEKQAAGLGAEFLHEVDAAVQRILHLPEASPMIENEIRRHLVRRFPYALLYRIEPDAILILAVMHLRRHPSYWTDRTQ